ncbi:SpoIIE family protein phosphatase [Streptomyces sp. D2-8]|nr:SpoIIE family protein phosphatase [Streptomyces sp. D2-8]
MACGGLTGHAAASGGAPGAAEQARGAAGGPASAGLYGTPSHPNRNNAQAAPGHDHAGADTPGADSASRTAPGHDPADAGVTGSGPRTGESDWPVAPVHGLAGTAAAGSGPRTRTPEHRAAPARSLPDPGAAAHNRSLPVAGVRAGGVNLPYGGAEYSGDAWAWVRAGDRVTLMLADGLGHGPEAARASSAAVAALHRWAHVSPAEALRRLHDALKGTRGAAVALAQLDLSTGRLRFTGIGNVGARLRTDGTWRHLLSRPGIVGVHRPTTLREEEAGWADDPLLILHTDGLPSRWTPPSDPALPAADPAVTAAVTIRDASSPARPVRDDTAVAVLTSTPPERP